MTDSPHQPRDSNGRFMNGDHRLRDLELNVAVIRSELKDTRDDISDIKADLKSSRALIRSVLITAAVSVVGQVVVFAVTRSP